MKRRISLLGALFGMASGSFATSSCAVEEERQVTLPESEASDMPWNRMQEGEGQGQLGAFQRR
jgi:hypothetical protein